MDEPKTRTWLCSVLFADIIQYSQQMVESQMRWKQRFNRYLGESIQQVAKSSRVILDTGDGAAVCFLGDPEIAMFAALRMLEFFRHGEPEESLPMRVRLGINLGSVKLVTDINGKLNAIGDGINVAQRVMSFAGDNEILVSRSFYEVVSCLSDDYSKLFRYEGVRTDKHVREHTVYNLVPLGAAGTAPVSPLGVPVQQPNPAPAPRASDVVSAPIIQIPFKEMGAEILDKARKDLARFVGPMARILVGKAATTARSQRQLYEMLATHVPAAERQTFMGCASGKT